MLTEEGIKGSTAAPAGLTRQEWARKFDHELFTQGQMAESLNNREWMCQYDLTGAMGERRKTAFLNSLDGLYRRYGQEYKNSFPENDSLGMEWLRLNVLPFSYNDLNGDRRILLGAAVWILDHISRKDGWFERLQECFDGMEPEPKEKNDLQFWDPVYGDTLFWKIEEILRRRNSGIESGGDMPDREKTVTDSISAEGLQHVSAASRIRFEKLVSMIPAEDIRHAEESFSRLHREWTDRYFTCISILLEDKQKRDREALDLRVKIHLTEKNRSELRLDMGKKNPEKGGSFPLPQIKTGIPFPSLSSAETVRSGRRTGMEFLMIQHKACEEKIEQDKRKLDQITEEQNVIRDRNIRFRMRCIASGGNMRSRFINLDGKETADSMKKLEIRDPFEVCFALLYLIDTGSDLPWLYAPGIGVMNEATALLPWVSLDPPEKEPDFSDKEFGYPEPQEKASEDPETSEEEYEDPEPEEKHPDIYERSYLAEDYPGTERKNLAQLLLKTTGCLMPRNLEFTEADRYILRQYGMTEESIDMFLVCREVISKLGSTGMRKILSECTGKNVAEKPGSEEEPNGNTETELREEIRTLRELNRSLKAALHHAETECRKGKELLQRERYNAAADRRELYELRELLFHKDIPEEEKSPEDTGIRFPYEVVKDTLIIGGHESWVKAIRAMLTGKVRFVAKNLLFDPSIIRYASVIWIQTNAIGHAQYIRAMNIARYNNKQVRYFSYNSAGKCAAQLAQNDKK